MRRQSLQLAETAASGSGELLARSPAQDGGVGVVAVGAPKLACQAPPLTLTQRWQVPLTFRLACNAYRVRILSSATSHLQPSNAT